MILEFDKSFSKSIDRINDSKVADKIEQLIVNIENVKAISEIKGVKKLVGFKNYYRIRIGDYRLGFELKSHDVVRFIIIAHRKDIYKIFP